MLFTTKHCIVIRILYCKYVKVQVWIKKEVKIQKYQNLTTAELHISKYTSQTILHKFRSLVIGKTKIGYTA